MNILVDLIHPANYHYFKYFISEMCSKGHNIVVTARKKDVLQELLELDNIKFISTGSGRFGKGAIGKLLYLIYAELIIFSVINKFKPNLVISFGSSACAHMSFLRGIPHIAFEDTEHAKLNRKIYTPFTDFIVTPQSFYDNVGKNHFKFHGYMELFYLHKKRFRPDTTYLKSINFNYDKEYVFLRFVSWEAFHDIGQRGLSYKNKLELIDYLKNKTNIYISSESELPEELAPYKLNVPANKVHDVLYFAKLYIGEGATMASECALLGVPAIYINSLPLMGYLKEELREGLLYHTNNMTDIITLTENILNNKESRHEFNKKKEDLLKNKIDPTSFLVWLVENYPQSKRILQNDSDYQYRFK
jgi:uncharacterized protein